MGGTPSVSYPTPTSEERAIQAKQLALLGTQEAREKELEPILLRSMGYARGDEGLTKLSPEEYYAGLDPMEQLSYDISREASERELKALRGELPVDPAVEREIEEGWLGTQERMGRQLGPGWEVSTPGIQATAEHKQRAAELRDAVRRGEMTTSEALSASRSGRMEEQKTRLAEQAGALSGKYGSMASLYETPKSWYERYRQGQFQSKQSKAALEAQKMGQISGSATSGCCFNFLEADGKISDHVRKIRDTQYLGTTIQRGYKIIARWLVPLMRKNRTIKLLVKLLMTKPITAIANCHYGENKYGWVFLPLGYMWKGIWHIIGRYSSVEEYTWEEFHGLSTDLSQT